MREFVFLFAYCFFVFAYCDGDNETETLQRPSAIWPRTKRSATGALHIQTNHVQPIHADVKPENGVDGDNKCKGPIIPSHIESGVVFQVTPPVESIYELKSLRKSLPLSSKLDVIRSISRVVTLAVLLVSAILEFHPLLQILYYTAYTFMYLK